MIIAIDFDGTLTQDDNMTLNMKALEVVKKLMKKHTCCLWTCREGLYLDAALLALKEQGIEFEWVNDSPYTNGSRKIVADYYIDDRMFGIWDWNMIEEHLINES